MRPAKQHLAIKNIRVDAMADHKENDTDPNGLEELRVS